MQGGCRHQGQSTGDGDTAPIVAGVPVLGGETRTSQQERKCQDTDNNSFNADEGIEDAHDPVPVVLEARLTKCP